MLFKFSAVSSTICLLLFSCSTTVGSSKGEKFAIGQQNTDVYSDVELRGIEEILSSNEEQKRQLHTGVGAIDISGSGSGSLRYNNDQRLDSDHGRRLDQEEEGLLELVFGNPNFVRWVDTVLSFEFLCTNVTPGLCRLLSYWATRLEAANFFPTPPPTPAPNALVDIIDDTEAMINDAIDQLSSGVCNIPLIYCPSEDNVEEWEELICRYFSTDFDFC